MSALQNLHTHTLYCDGTLTVEQMIIAAIEKGCDSIGFSGHSYTEFDLDYCMTLETTHEYINEVFRLREKYASKIDIFLGTEQEYHSDSIIGNYDYIIGSVHYIKKGDRYFVIDADAETFTDIVRTEFLGDYYALTKMYYETIANITKKTNPDIVGHFDIVTKFNMSQSLFDESDSRYIDPAISAMEEILKTCRLFEVNTRAIYKVGKLEPYPSFFLLRELLRRGGEVILSSDSHEADSICCKFDEMREVLKSLGYKYTKQLTKEGLIAITL